MSTLYLSTTSPYTRLLLTLAILKKIELELKWVLPWENPSELTDINPFSQVPVLVYDSGEVITETPLIIQALAPTFYGELSKPSFAKVSQAFTITAQGVRAFSTLRFGNTDTPHPFVTRSTKLLMEVLPTLPSLSAVSEDWGERFLLCALIWIEQRLPEVFQSLSLHNQKSVLAFKSNPLQTKLDATALAVQPQNSLDF